MLNLMNMPIPDFCFQYPDSIEDVFSHQENQKHWLLLHVDKLDLDNKLTPTSAPKFRRNGNLLKFYKSCGVVLATMLVSAQSETRQDQDVHNSSACSFQQIYPVIFDTTSMLNLSCYPVQIITYICYVTSIIMYVVYCMYVMYA